MMKFQLDRLWLSDENDDLSAVYEAVEGAIEDD